MKKNDLQLGDDGEFTVDLDVPVRSVSISEKFKRISDTKQKHEPITRMEIKLSNSEPSQIPIAVGVLATFVMLFSCFIVIFVLSGMPMWRV
jgi:hypothetical protein